MIKVTAYETSDKKLFSTENEAEEYEVYLAHGNIIEKFLDSDSNLYRGVGQRGIARNSILAFRLYEQKNKA